MTSSSFCFPSTTKTVERCRCFIHFSGVSLSSQAVTSLSWWSWTPPNDNFNHSSEQMIKKVLILWQNRSQTAKDSFFDIYELHLWQRDEGAPRTAFSVCLELRVHQNQNASHSIDHNAVTNTTQTLCHWRIFYWRDWRIACGEPSGKRKGWKRAASEAAFFSEAGYWSSRFTGNFLYCSSYSC